MQPAASRQTAQSLARCRCEPPSFDCRPCFLRCRTVYDYVDDNLAEAMDEMERELREVWHLQQQQQSCHTAAEYES